MGMARKRNAHQRISQVLMLTKIGRHLRRTEWLNRLGLPNGQREIFNRRRQTKRPKMITSELLPKDRALSALRKLEGIWTHLHPFLLCRVEKINV